MPEKMSVTLTTTMAPGKRRTTVTTVKIRVTIRTTENMITTTEMDLENTVVGTTIHETMIPVPANQLFQI